MSGNWDPGNIRVLPYDITTTNALVDVLILFFLCALIGVLVFSAQVNDVCTYDLIYVALAFYFVYNVMHYFVPKSYTDEKRNDLKSKNVKRDEA